MPVVRVRRANPIVKWTIRWSNPPQDWEARIEELFDEGHFKYVVAQLEMSESGTPHVQGYFELKKKQRRSTVSALFGDDNPHFEAARGNAKQNLRYCTKHCSACYKGDACTLQTKDYQMSDPIIFGAPAKVGKAALMEGLWDAIEKGEDAYSIVSETPALLAHRKALEWAEQLRMRKLGNRWREVEVTVLVGPPGVGKTLWPVNLHGYEGIYTMTKLNKGAIWFDGYEGQTAVVLDDFDSDWSVAYRALLRILDGHPLRLPVKGGFTYALYDKVYITTNVEVRHWYKERTEIDALLRRIDRVVSVGKDAFGVPHAFENGNEIPFPEARDEAPVLPVVGREGEGGTGGLMTSSIVVPVPGLGGNAAAPSAPPPQPILSRLRRADAFIGASAFSPPTREEALLLHNLRSLSEEEDD